jgi:hypothetical protein
MLSAGEIVSSVALALMGMVPILGGAGSAGRLLTGENQREREAQQRIVQMILPDDEVVCEMRMERNGPDESLGGEERNRR